MKEKKDNARVSKEFNGLSGFFLLIIGFSIVCGSFISRILPWVLPGLILLIFGYLTVRKADMKPEIETEKKRK